jgi:excisionase family DNA binding protein
MMTDRHPGEIDVGTAVLGLMTIKRVSELLDFSERQIRRMIASGALEAVKDGGSVRILPESIIAYKQRLRGARGEPVPCGTCGGSPPAAFICTGCGRTGRVAS